MRPADEAANGCPSSRSETKKCPGLNLTVQTGLSIQTGALVLGVGRKAQLLAASASAQHSCGQREILYNHPHPPTEHSVPVVPFLWELLSETVQPDGAQWDVLAVCRYQVFLFRNLPANLWICLPVSFRSGFCHTCSWARLPAFRLPVWQRNHFTFSPIQSKTVCFPSSWAWLCTKSNQEK